MQKKANASTEKMMKIGEVAKLSGVGVETIRFYEREGILPKPKRKASGYRQFDLDTVHRIRFIKNVQDLGFSLSEAGDLASAKGVSAAIKRISQRIESLKTLQRELEKQLKTMK
jgi:MerR family transcriptional regulator, copper efflux regulator